MLFSLLKQSFLRQKKAMALMVISVSMGTALASSLIALSMDIKGKVSRELRSFGANITVEPKVEGFAGLVDQKRYLREADIIKAKTIFWRHNIIGIAPFLEADVELKAGSIRKTVRAVGTWFEKELPLPGETSEFEAGVMTVLPWWTLEGSLPHEQTVLLGTSLMDEAGIRQADVIYLDGMPYKAAGRLSTGGREDRQVFLDLDAMQSLKGLEDRVSRVLISALTTPMDDFAYKDPSAMSRKEYEKWYCTGYVTSIAKQLEDVFEGARAKPIWHIAETEGRVLGRMSILIYLLSASTLIASALGVSTTMVAGQIRRLDEIGLMKSIGADSLQITIIFLSEAVIIGLGGGIMGYGLSTLAVKFIGLKVFGTGITERALLFPLSLLSGLLIASLGSLLPIKKALRIKPAVVLKGTQ